MLVTVVHASGCAPLLLYVLLYGLDTYASRQLRQTPASGARSTGVGFFVPKAERHTHSPFARVALTGWLLSTGAHQPPPEIGAVVTQFVTWTG